LGLPRDAVDVAGYDDLLDRLTTDAGPPIGRFLVLVDAHHGITADTREHAALLRALGLSPGLVVLSGDQMADPAGVLRKTAQLIPGTPAHAVCLRTADGLPDLARALDDLLASPPPPPDLPAAGLAGPGPPLETRVIDAALDFGPHREREPDHGARATVHLRGAPAPARLARLGGRFWQVRLDQPLLALTGDRFVIRQADGSCTLGGGVVLDPAARRHPTSNDVIVTLTRIWRGQPPPMPDPAAT
ncbi:MAG TPA: hypothetical protein VHW26_09360, partial [Solirubrobacteraceae bacterium]|nr:hypothetical protein [Solirubrobacteraceae bacterium]